MTDNAELTLFVPVIRYHLTEAIRLMKATGEGPDPEVWDEIRLYMPPERRKR